MLKNPVEDFSQVLHEVLHSTGDLTSAHVPVYIMLTMRKELTVRDALRLAADADTDPRTVLSEYERMSTGDPPRNRSRERARRAILAWLESGEAA